MDPLSALASRPGCPYGFRGVHAGHMLPGSRFRPDLMPLPVICPKRWIPEELRRRYDRGVHPLGHGSRNLFRLPVDALAVAALARIQRGAAKRAYFIICSHGFPPFSLLCCVMNLYRLVRSLRMSGVLSLIAVLILWCCRLL